MAALVPTPRRRRLVRRALAAGLAALAASALAGGALPAEPTITPGGPPVTVSVLAPGDVGTVTFDAVAGQRVSLEMTDVTIGTSTCCSTKVSIAAPDGRTLVSATLGTTGGFIDAQSLPETGTYSIVVDPQSTSTGSITLTLHDVPRDVAGAIAPGGPPVDVSLDVPGQNGRLGFDGALGQRVSIEVTDVTLASTKVSIVKPDGRTLVSTTVGRSGAFIDTQTLPSTGAYAVVVDPQKAAVGTLTLALHDVPADATAGAFAGGAPVTVTTSTPGQNARVTFPGQLNQRISVAVTDVCCSSRVSILKPDGKVLVSATVGKSGGFLDTQALPATGTYTILVDPQAAAFGSVTLTVYDVPPDVTDTIAPGGPAVTVTTGTPGQNVQLAFTGTAGQRVSLQLGPVCCSTKVSILKPGGSTLLAPTNIGSGGGFVDVQTLPTSGTYTIVVDPQGSAVGSMTVRLHDVPADVTATIVPGGASVTVTTGTPGQNARLTFTGTAGQRVSVKIGPVCCSTKVSLLRSTGATVASASFGSSGGFMDVQTLPVSGTYTLLVDPQGASTGSVTVALFDVPPDATGTISLGGPPVTVTTTVPGQNAKLTFAGAAGQRVSIAVDACCTTTVALLRPDGTSLGSTTVFGGSGFLDTRVLPVTGTYTVSVDLQSSATGTVTLTAYDVPPDATGTIVPDGAPVTVTAGTPGQNARLTFDGTAGRRMSVELTSVTIGTSRTSGTKVSILKPDGTALVGATNVGTDGGLIETQALPVSGVYAIVVDPQGANTGSMTVTLHDLPADVAAAIVPGGSPVTVTIAEPGQNARVTFDGSSGQRVSLELSSVTIGTSACCSTKVSILEPGGTALVAPVNVGTTGGFIDAEALAVGGTHTILVDPQGAATGNITLTLHAVPADATAGIVAGGAPVSLATGTPGQNMRLVFDGTAGQRVSVKIGPVCCITQISILRADGAAIFGPSSFSAGGGFIDTLTLPATGTYTIFVDPTGAATGSATLTLYDVPPDVAATTAIGSSVTVTTSVPGQNAEVSFDANAEDGVRLTVGPFNCCSTRISVVDPSGGTVVAPTGFNPDGGNLFMRLPVAGSYTIVVDPQGAATGSIHLGLVLDNTAPSPPVVTLAETSADSHVVGTSFFYRPSGAGGGFTVSATAADGGFGIQKVRFPGLTGGFTPTSATDDLISPYSQAYSWAPGATFDSPANTVTAYDKVGNTASSSFAVVRDANPPVTGDNTASIGSDWKNTTQTVVLSPSDGAGAGTAATYSTTDGSTPTTASPLGTTVTLSADGVYTVKYFSVDNVGNAEDVRSAGTQVRVDKTRPSSAVLDPLPSVIKNGQVLTGSGADALSGVASISYLYCAGGNCTPTTVIGSSSAASSYPITWSVQPPDGTYQLVARVRDVAGNTLDSVKRTVTVDNTPPHTTITAQPANPTNQASASFGFTSSEAGSTFQCRLDDAPFSACTSPTAYSGLAPGSHTFEVRATDPVGHTDASPAAYSWVVDVTPPDTTITSAPASPSDQASASFTFTASEAGSSFQCRLDGAAFAACTSPRTYSGLGAGTHTFEVRATDAAGNTDASPAAHTWVVDLTAPQTTIVSAPVNPTNQTSASFGFTSSEASSTFQCRLDDAPFSACTSPTAYSGLAPGSHTFEVRATDPAGNTDASPAAHTWVVDLTAPQTSVVAGPANPTSSTAASFEFVSSEPGSTFECALDGAAFTACTSSQTYSGLAAGSHSFEVRATDAAGNTDASPAAYTWVVDLSPPETTITAGPADPSSSAAASFTFTASEAGSMFACSLDGAPFAACASPKSYAGLAPGLHTFEVQATDPAGNTDASPALYSWTVDLSAPETTITEAPPTPTGSTSASFSFAASEPGTTFECSLDGAGFSACESPRAYAGLAEGGHTFEVRATDPAGNTDPSPAAHTWVVDLTAPDTAIASRPPNETNETSAAFGFTATEAGSSFECSLDGGAFEACESPRSYSGLAEGSHSFEVRATDPVGNTDASPASDTWVIDATAPAPPVIENPPEGTRSNTGSFTLTGAAEPGSTVEIFEGTDSKGVAVTSAGGSWAKGLSGVPQGSHVYTATARDAAGNTSGTSNPRTIVVDTSAPNTTITGGPIGSTKFTSAALSFTADDPAATFECRLDGAPFTACTSPKSYTGLSQGTHTFEVRATDAAGNTDTTPASRTWTVDFTAPAPPVIESPADGSILATATITLSGTAEAGSFVEVFDGTASKGGTTATGSGTWSKTLTGVVDGSHTYTAKATDAASNTSAASNARTIVVDTVPPTTTIFEAPGSPTSSTAASFTFEANEPGSSFECSLDGAAFAACTSPQSYSGLASGSHTFRVRAIDSAGNVDGTPAEHTWTIDVDAPETTIASGPPDPTVETAATFEFASSEAGSTFECSLDGAPFSSCSSPQTYNDLTTGTHTFEVRATDSAGNADATPASYSWTVT
ncbi:MAG TPA: Ig-like domain-containing protein [Gaiellaceae bacterium]|nr:Ig-like domain-containing protein [Gaiellaceae bacterium]